METLDHALVRAEFAPVTTYLNTASTGLLPSRAVAAMSDAVASVASKAGRRHVRGRRGGPRRVRPDHAAYPPTGWR